MFSYLLRHGCRMPRPFPPPFGHPINIWVARQLVGCHLVLHWSRRINVWKYTN